MVMVHALLDPRMATSSTIPDYLSLILNRKPGTGGNPHGFLALYGADMVEVTAFEPDPITYRKDYYYNAVLNRLYKRVVTTHAPEIGVIRAYWMAVSN